MSKYRVNDIVTAHLDSGKIRRGMTLRVQNTIEHHDGQSLFVHRINPKDGLQSWIPNSVVEGRHACPECGMDYPDDLMREHLRDEHDMDYQSEHTQAEAEMMEIDRIEKEKADKYDQICELLFMSCGIIEDGDSIKYIIDPETVVDELLKIVVTDDNVDREYLVDKHKRIFKEKTGW